MIIDKEFILSDSSVNSYGYRLLTSGYLIDEFAKNPIGYFMHGTPENPREQGVLVKWVDLRISGDKVMGKPDINLSHPRGEKTVEEIKNGFLNAASFGHFVILDMTDEPTQKLQGQTGVTVTKWFNRECSLVDIPGNFNALKLYDKNGEEIKLSNLISNKTLIDNPMKQKPIPTTNIDVINDEKPTCKIDVSKQLTNALNDNDITPEMKAIFSKDYIDEHDKLKVLLCGFAKDRLSILMNTPFDELDKSGELEELNNKYLQGKKHKYYEEFPNVENVLEDAINDGFIDEETAKGYKRNFGSDPAKLVDVVYKNIQYKIDNLMNESWDTLSANGQIDFLKKNFLQGFKQKYVDKYGIEYQEPNKKY